MDKIKSHSSLLRKQRIKLVIKPNEKSLNPGYSSRYFNMYIDDDQKFLSTNSSGIRNSASPFFKRAKNTKSTKNTEEALAKLKKLLPPKSTNSYRIIVPLKPKTNKSQKILKQSEKSVIRLRKNFKLKIFDYKNFVREVPSWTLKENQLEPALKKPKKQKKEFSFELKGWD